MLKTHKKNSKHKIFIEFHSGICTVKNAFKKSFEKVIIPIVYNFSNSSIIIKFCFSNVVNKNKSYCYCIKKKEKVLLKLF
jgi:hypothetical protein